MEQLIKSILDKVVDTFHIHTYEQMETLIYPVFLCYFLVLFGLVWGSFADCAVSRWAAGKKMFSRRSHCLSCGHTLGVVDLIPVIGFLVRRGRCHYCGEKIPADCLIAELAGAVGLALIGGRFGPTLAVGQWIVWAAVLLALSLTDAARRIIPDRLLVVLAVNRVVWFFILREGPDAVWEALRALIVPVVLLALVLLAEKLLGREVMGGGDIKLLFALALYLSWAQLLLTLLAGCAVGLVFAALARVRHGTAMPFGPFLAAGAVVVVCFADPLIQWYFSLF